MKLGESNTGNLLHTAPPLPYVNCFMLITKKSDFLLQRVYKTLIIINVCLINTLGRKDIYSLFICFCANLIMQGRILRC